MQKLKTAKKNCEEFLDNRDSETGMDERRGFLSSSILFVPYITVSYSEPLKDLSRFMQTVLTHETR